MRSKPRYGAATICTLCTAALSGWLALVRPPVLAATPPVAERPARAPTIRVTDAWIRWLPAGVPAGGYATLTNTGEKPVTLLTASSAEFAEVSIHRSIERGNNMEMMPVERITIDPHSTLDFAATGYHLMLMEPSTSLKPGGRVPITLRFADGSRLTVQFEVRK